ELALIATTRTAARLPEAATLRHAPPHPCAPRRFPRRGARRARRQRGATRAAPQFALDAACPRTRRRPDGPPRARWPVLLSVPRFPRDSPVRRAFATGIAPQTPCRDWRPHAGPARARVRAGSTGSRASATTVRFPGSSRRDTLGKRPSGVCLRALRL